MWCLKQRLAPSKHSKYLSEEREEKEREREGFCVKPFILSGVCDIESEKPEFKSCLYCSTCVSPDKLFNTSNPQFPHLENGEAMPVIQWEHIKISTRYLYYPPSHHHFHYILQPSVPFNWMSHSEDQFVSKSQEGYCHWCAQYRDRNISWSPFQPHQHPQMPT